MARYAFAYADFQFSLWLVAITLAISFLLLLVHHVIYPRLRASTHLWDDILLKALHWPVQTGVWLYGLTYALEASPWQSDFLAIEAIGMHVRAVVGILCFLWFAWYYLNLLEQRILANTYLVLQLYDKAKLLSVMRLMRGLLIILIVLLLLPADASLSKILAFGGIGAVVIGLAAKDVLANFFGGLLIYADRPFTIGDVISSPDKDIEGTVEHIGWRLTTVRRANKQLLYIPNSVFSTLVVENGSQITHRHLAWQMALRYTDLPLVDTLCARITQLLLDHPAIDHQLLCFAKLQQLADSSLLIKIQAYTAHVDYADFITLQHQLLLKIAEQVTEMGASFALTTQTVDLPPLSVNK